MREGVYGEDALEGGIVQIEESGDWVLDFVSAQELQEECQKQWGR